MKVLLIGSGGREHALAWTLAKSPLLDHLYCAPGNAGMAETGTCVPIPDTDLDGIEAFVARHGIDLVVIGPEAPLVSGLVDRLNAAGVRSFGPAAAAARLEGSKGFTKDLCAQFAIPTAAYARFSDAGAAKSFIHSQKTPVVIKADGLAAGKGVILPQTLAEAEEAVDQILGGQFGQAGAEIVIEERLTGEEASFFALCDGKNAIPLASAQDHKCVGEGDTGPNTGGMGAYSPAPVMTDAVCGRVMNEIIMPTLTAMQTRGTPFKGVLYAGIMITEQGPQLIEYNVRFGDPECQVLMSRLDCDLLPALVACHDGTLEDIHLTWKKNVALSVVMASRGYPGPYEKKTPIHGLDKARATGATVFHAGTVEEKGILLSNGGRVLNVTAEGASVREAQQKAYRAVDQIDWPQGFCRRDIGWRAAKREATKSWHTVYPDQ